MTALNCSVADLTDNPFIENIASSYGAILVGSFLSCVLWGVSTLQAYLYYWSYEDDPAALKAFVAGLWVLDTTNEILVLKSSWKVLIREYGKLANLTEQQPELMHHTWVEAILMFCVQLYFIRRIWIFSNRKHTILAAVLIVLSAWQWIGVVVYLALGYGKGLARLAGPMEANINISLRAAAVVVDIVVTFYMVKLLTSPTSTGQPHFARTRRMFHRMLVIVVNTGLATAVLASVTFILVRSPFPFVEPSAHPAQQIAAQPDNLYYCITEYVLCSSYYSSFLANLNSRHFVKGEGGITTISNSNIGGHNTVYLGPMRRSEMSSGGTRTQLTTERSDGNLKIQVQKEQEMKIDGIVRVPSEDDVPRNEPKLAYGA
ncbi:hypothetical protein OF83DRAFT_243103 [Amylostereum chailletii]|nr:hypothetical protein OF83DRAFT_243103 [Amylostereum chailletii]